MIMLSLIYIGAHNPQLQVEYMAVKLQFCDGQPSLHHTATTRQSYDTKHTSSNLTWRLAVHNAGSHRG